MRMRVFSFSMLVIVINCRENLSTSRPAAPVHIMALILLHFGQDGSVSKVMLFAVALSSSEGHEAPACTGRVPSKTSGVFVTPRE